MARQPLWWVGRWLALLGDEALAWQGLAGTGWDLGWALEVLREVERGQAAFV